MELLTHLDQKYEIDCNNNLEDLEPEMRWYIENTRELIIKLKDQEQKTEEEGGRFPLKIKN
jgi:hypothetical protein